MKIKTWIKYEESYLPPRCRKLRYRECEDYINVNLKEVDASELKLAFEDNSYNGKGKIFFYKNKLWSKVERNHSIAKEYGTKSALEDLIWIYKNSSRYFRFPWEREKYGFDTSRDSVIKAVRNGIKNYILIDNELYTVTPEPRYVIITFGLGYNHGGTSMFVEYSYNPNIRKENYFSALDSEKAIAYANKVAVSRGDTNDVGKFKETIVVHMPEIVKIKP